MHYPTFINNSDYYHLDQSHDNTQQLIALSENIKRIYQLTSKHFDSFEILISEYLRNGIEIFQMQTGIVSHITTDNTYIVKDVVTNMDVIHPGDEYELEGTYCREVASSKMTLGFPCVGNLVELKDHPVYVNLKLEAYLSAPIFVNDKLYGTLNFTSLNPRENGFSEQEHDLISMMSQAIGNFILLQEKEDKLKQLNYRMKELVGHLSHDLRNPLGSIQGLANLALTRNLSPEKTQEMFKAISTESTRSLELVNTILNQAALSTGKLSIKPVVFNLSSLIDKIQKAFTSIIEEKSLSLYTDVHASTSIFGDEERLQQVLSNLLNNAFKYAPKNSCINIKTNTLENKLRISIYNLTSDAQDIPSGDLYQSIGYGLDIVKEILHMHGTELFINEEEKSYEVSFELDTKENTRS